MNLAVQDILVEIKAGIAQDEADLLEEIESGNNLTSGEIVTKVFMIYLFIFT